MSELEATIGDSPDTLIAMIEDSDQKLEATVGDSPEVLVAVVEDC